MFILFICWCLCTCSLSNHALAATIASEYMSNVNTEKTLVNPPNTSLIQQVMTRFLFLLGKVLTYKVLLIGISIAMIYILYENDNTSLQQKPSKPRRKSPPNQQQKKHPTDSFGPSRLSERRRKSDSQKEGIESRQNGTIQGKKSKPQHQQRPLNVSKKEIPKQRQPDVGSEEIGTQQSQITQRKEPETPHQQQSSNASKENNSKQPQPDIEKRLETQQIQMTQRKETETQHQHQQNPLNVYKEEGPKNPIPQGLKQERPEKREKFDNEHLNIRKEVSSVQYIQDGQRPGDGWIWIDRGRESFWVYYPDLQQGTKGKYRPVSRLVPLSNSFIPHPSHDVVWVNPKLYKDRDMESLATTSKYAYIQFKKLPNLKKKNPNLYMLHPTYITCVISMTLRALLIKIDPIQRIYSDPVGNEFENFYAVLFNEAKKEGYISYESFREVSSSYRPWWDTTVKNFLTLQFLENRQWILEDLIILKDALKEELMRVMEKWVKARKYNFIPQIHKVNPNLYQEILTGMQLLKVPFCNCPKVSQLLVSSLDAPLKLFLFWDIFNALKMKTLVWILTLQDHEQPFLKCHCYVNILIDDIIKVYSNQNGKYLEDLYFELVDFIQEGFFGNDQLYDPSQTKGQRWIAFDDYMLGIQGNVQSFLEDAVFNGPPIAIRI